MELKEITKYPLWYRCVCNVLHFILPRLFDDWRESKKMAFSEGYAYGCIDTKKKLEESVSKKA